MNSQLLIEVRPEAKLRALLEIHRSFQSALRVDDLLPKIKQTTWRFQTTGVLRFRVGGPNIDDISKRSLRFLPVIDSGQSTRKFCTSRRSLRTHQKSRNAILATIPEIHSIICSVREGQ